MRRGLSALASSARSFGRNFSCSDCAFLPLISPFWIFVASMASTWRAAPASVLPPVVTRWNRSASADRSGVRTARRRSTTRGRIAPRLGVPPRLPSSARSAFASRSSSGCRFCQTMAGMSLSSPQFASTSIRSGMGSTPSSLRAAMATCSCTSRDGSLASATTLSRTPVSRTLPALPAARTAPGAEARVRVRQQLLMEDRIETAAADQRPQRVHPGLARRLARRGRPSAASLALPAWPARPAGAGLRSRK